MQATAFNRSDIGPSAGAQMTVRHGLAVEAAEQERCGLQVFLREGLQVRELRGEQLVACESLDVVKAPRPACRRQFECQPNSTGNRTGLTGAASGIGGYPAERGGLITEHPVVDSLSPVEDFNAIGDLVRARQVGAPGPRLEPRGDVSLP